MHCASIKKTLIGFFPISEWIKFVTLLSICGAEPFYSVFFLIFAPSNCTETLYRVYILWNVDENEWNGCNAQRTTKPTIKNVYTRNARSDGIVLIFYYMQYSYVRPVNCCYGVPFFRCSCRYFSCHEYLAPTADSLFSLSP